MVIFEFRGSIVSKTKKPISDLDNFTAAGLSRPTHYSATDRQDTWTGRLRQMMKKS